MLLQQLLLIQKLKLKQILLKKLQLLRFKYNKEQQQH